jgi:ribosomal peptide maturation radical SAM protein 1
MEAPMPSPALQPQAPPAVSRVALVNMPFAMADRPSIQCGLLKAELTRAGHEADVVYLNLELAAEIGARLYKELSRQRFGELLGEWLFSVAAFGHRGDEAAYHDACGGLDEHCASLGLTFDDLCDWRKNRLPAWIATWAERIDWALYSVIGFTSTFEQNTAAFALARSIKERHPEIPIVFGGANFDGTMGKEFVRALPFIDYAVVGEGDTVFPLMVERLLRGESPVGLAGVVGRGDDGAVLDGGPGAPVTDINALPDPDYDEYFATLFRLERDRVLHDASPLLLFESARGCWWGQKQHCTFCGLNNNGMSFRSRAAAGVADQLGRLASRYQIVNFEAVDNIMSHRYLDELCPPLAERRYDYRIFYEVKANLTAAQLRLMAKAGINSIQPGIESLSTHVLSLMRKGITMLRNVRLLKWAYYYGMHVSWNVLTGFPGETAEDYAQQLQAVAVLRHLPPPSGCGPIWLERFSPYFFDPAFPVRDVKPLRCYRYIYPREQVNLDEIAYFFEYRMESTLPFEHHAKLREEIARWNADWKRKSRPVLVYQRAPDWIQVVDRRDGEAAVHAFHRHEAAIYEFCGETDRTLEAIYDHLARSGRHAVPATEIEESLRKFCDLGLMLEESQRFLSLALPANSNW